MNKFKSRACNEEAEVVLKKYRKQIVALSEYEELTEWDDMVEIWTFNEVRSGVEFIFTFDFDTYTWTIEPDEDSMEDYFSDRL